MSHGPGRIMRMVMDILHTAQDHDDTHPGYSAEKLAAKIYGESPSEHQVQSVRRAIRRLLAEGQIESRKVSHFHIYLLPGHTETWRAWAKAERESLRVS
jgi:hypothetical protein